MAHMDIATLETAVLSGKMDAGEACFRMGMMCSASTEVPDYVSAHKWFNIAAMKGNKSAAAYRQELAAEMSAAEIASAQRAAREWLTLH